MHFLFPILSIENSNAESFYQQNREKYKCKQHHKEANHFCLFVCLFVCFFQISQKQNQIFDLPHNIKMMLSAWSSQKIILYFIFWYLCKKTEQTNKTNKQKQTNKKHSCFLFDLSVFFFFFFVCVQYNYTIIYNYIINWKMTCAEKQ